jgi:hypothetical protein
MNTSGPAMEPRSKSPPASKSELPEQDAVAVCQERENGPPEKRLKTAPTVYPAVMSDPAATTPSTTATAPSSSLLHPGDETPISYDFFAAPLPVAEDEPTSASHMDVVRRAAHSESVSSDLSSASAATAEVPQSYRYDMKEDIQERATGGNNNSTRHHTQSPNLGFSDMMVPPAPPSTPASYPSIGLSFSFDGIADFVGPPTLTSSTSTPMAPMLGRGSYVRNADRLELQQQLLEGATTPAPTKSTTGASTASLTAATPKASTGAGAATPKPSGSASIPLPEDFSDWAVGDRYELVRILGRGSYGEVAQAIDLTKTAAGGGEPAYVAIKRIQSPFDQQLDAVRLYREIHILRRMKEGGDETGSSSTNPPESRHHDCIIQLLNVVQPPTDDLDDFHDLYLVFECKYRYAPTLASFDEQGRNG